MAALILGFLSLLSMGVTAIPAIICGHIALFNIRKSKGRLGGRGMAIWGLIFGYGVIGVLGLVVLSEL